MSKRCQAMAVSNSPSLLKQNKNGKKNKTKDLVTLELKFIKKLAGNDPRLSEKEFKKLRKWLSLRSSNPFTDKDIMGLWRALYFCMWMSDKPENLAENSASLLHCFNKQDVSIQFFGAFLKCLGREWTGIDQCRIDKFMMLVRRVTRQCFVVLNNTNWDKKLIKQLNAYIKKCILDKSSAAGFLMHFIEIFLEEIAKVSVGKIVKSKVALLIQPFAKCIAMQRDHKIISHTIKHIFDALLYQSDLGREYKDKFDAWRRMGLPDSERENTVTSHLDSRAGRVDVIMPEIPFDPEEIIKILERFKHEPYTNVKGRRTIRKLIDRYSTFATGKFPLGINYMKINENQIHLPNVENELLHSTKEVKKLNKKKRKKAIAHTEVQPKKQKISRQQDLKQKKKKLVNSWVETDLSPDEIAVNVSKVTSKKSSTNISSCQSAETDGISIESRTATEILELFSNVIERWLQADMETSVYSPFHDVHQLTEDFEEFLTNMDDTSKERILQLLPYLAANLADEGKLTIESTLEQAIAGLDTISSEQYLQLSEMIEKYQTKFEFPFVICVRETNKIEAILRGITLRLENQRHDELITGINEVKKICRLRIGQIVDTI